MASEVDICNSALSHIGDSATVSSIDPPEGSAQAEYCAMYYPIARDSLLEMHNWGFAIKHNTLAKLDRKGIRWRYCYAVPNDCHRVIQVLSASGEPVDYEREAMDNGQLVIYTNTPDAWVRYLMSVKDTTQFSSLFVVALSWHLASMLAGVVIKGDTGAQYAAICETKFQQYLTQAKNSDSLQHKVSLDHVPVWMRDR